VGVQVPSPAPIQTMIRLTEQTVGLFTFCLDFQMQWEAELLASLEHMPTFTYLIKKRLAK
jgi:hypothetical protein